MLIEEEDVEGDRESVQEFTSLRISSFDEEQEGAEIDGSIKKNDVEDEDEDEEDDEEEALVTLGFVEKPENNWSLQSQVFPSKAGGVPAWLDLENLPSGKTFLCDMCEEPLQFLLQVYAPISEKDSTFHRTLFVFMCPSMACLLRDQHEQWKRGPEKPLRSVKVFRCQLPRDNTHYKYESPRYDGSDKPVGISAPLCMWCGTWKGAKICTSCRRARYCSEKHQALHWRAGHKLECQKHIVDIQSGDADNVVNRASLNGSPKVASRSLWPEYKIIDDFESELSMSDDDENSKSLVKAQRVDESIKSIMETFEGDDDKKSWAKFQERLARDPEQVLRYSRDERARPLWPASSGRPSKADLPKCSYCGGAMKFEFQILPQLLDKIDVENDVNSLDWATIVVYTCANSCEGSAPSYKEEFAWVQLA